ncbi:hypothetical protein, partial [Bacteroides heparinolyticus]|uniref:hypothetical protein n=1 Tax=Prevotella heparinolytica TaxID=28113 RepID=UPI0035A14990
GKGNYEVDYYEHILRALEEFTDEEDAHRIYVEGVRTCLNKGFHTGVPLHTSSCHPSFFVRPGKSRRTPST